MSYLRTLHTAYSVTYLRTLPITYSSIETTHSCAPHSGYLKDIIFKDPTHCILSELFKDPTHHKLFHRNYAFMCATLGYLKDIIFKDPTNCIKFKDPTYCILSDYSRTLAITYSCMKTTHSCSLHSGRNIYVRHI